MVEDARGATGKKGNTCLLGRQDIPEFQARGTNNIKLGFGANVNSLRGGSKGWRLRQAISVLAFVSQQSLREF